MSPIIGHAHFERLLLEDELLSEEAFLPYHHVLLDLISFRL